MRLAFEEPFDPASEPDFERFPAAPAVFVLFTSSAGEVSQEASPYVGRTRNLKWRLGRLLGKPESGMRRLNLRAITRRIAYQPVGSYFEAQWLLFELSRLYDPAHYQRRLRLKPPALVKVKLRNRFPRCYVSTRLANDGSLYFGPFPSRAAAEEYMGGFLDLFKLRRCVPNLDPDPSFPGCIYSQMKKCLAPCFMGCTDDEYAAETHRVVAFLQSNGETLETELAAERGQASNLLEFELASRAHSRLEEASRVSRLRPALVREISSLDAIVLLRGAGEKAVTFFRVTGGTIHGPGSLSLAANTSSPVPLDTQIQQVLAALVEPARDSGSGSVRRGLPPWEHLSLLARWYYSSSRLGEIVMLPASRQIPHARMVRLCRKIVEQAP